MVQLTILSGKKAGQSVILQSVPSLIGRSADADLRLEDDGVWDRHLELRLSPAKQFTLVLQPNALATVNGLSFSQTTLHNGDVIQLGQARIQFWLSRPTPRSLLWREYLTWIFLAAVCLVQIAIVYWLIM